MKKAAIIQPSFIPWKGYFDIIHDVDVFVFLEDVQYTTRDWRNRNRIKTPGGTKWISVPVVGGINQLIYEARIDYSQDWRETHIKTIHHSYAASPFYESYRDQLFAVYKKKFETISELNIFATKLISRLLGIDVEYVRSTDLHPEGAKDNKLIDICNQIGADVYLSGPTAQKYIDATKFDKADILLVYKNYHGYPAYRQLWGDYDPYVSIIDLLFNCGENSPYFTWGWRQVTAANVTKLGR
jgi:WbqC-like protein family